MTKADMPIFTRAGHYLTNLVIVGVIRTALALPYEMRLRLVGGFVEHIAGPLANYRRRAEENLAMVWPDMDPPERRQIAKRCLNNAGRTFIENYSARDFPARMADQPLTGPGVAAFQEATDAGRPVILVTGHYGNYEAVRATLVGQGHLVGGLYRNMANPYFNAHYVQTMQAFGGPVFAQGRRGTAGFVRHLKEGGQLVLLFDQHVSEAPVLRFLGHPAHTAISAAELALRYDAVLLPFYGIRQPDGLSFETRIEAPVAHSDPKTMTQTLNDSLEERIRFDPGQWFWVHRRWKAEHP